MQKNYKQKDNQHNKHHGKTPSPKKNNITLQHFHNNDGKIKVDEKVKGMKINKITLKNE